MGRTRHCALGGKVRRIGGALLALALWACAWRAAAQESSGTWGGSLEGRGNYYWERSTRVVVPAIKARLVAPSGIRVGVGYLVDAITSASIAGGASSDSLKTELRHAVTADVGKEFDLGDAQLDFTLLGTYSNEPDYKSIAAGLISSIAFDEKNTKLLLSATRVQDRVLDNADRTFDRGLSGMTVGPAWEQILSPVMVLTIGYQFGYLQGYLGNPYRRAVFAAHAPERESPPESRYRHAANARLQWFIPGSNTAVHLIYTAYGDSWDVSAIGPELRVYQQLGENWLLRPRYRFYAQTKAYFALSGVAKYPAGYEKPTTNDPKLTGFRTHTLGLSVEYHLSLLAGTVLDFAKDTWLDLAFDRYWSNSSFGNGIIATAGGRLTF